MHCEEKIFLKDNTILLQFINEQNSSLINWSYNI